MDSAADRATVHGSTPRARPPFLGREQLGSRAGHGIDVLHVRRVGQIGAARRVAAFSCHYVLARARARHQTGTRP